MVVNTKGGQGINPPPNKDNTMNTAELSALWDSLTWYEQDEIAVAAGHSDRVIEGETGMPAPSWLTTQHIIDFVS